MLFERMKKLLGKRTEAQVVDDGRRAEHWLNDRVFNLAIAQMKQATINLWIQSADPVARERCWVRMADIDAFVGELNAILGDGKKAQNDADRQARKP